MSEVKITLGFLWVAVMLTYLLGDVLRIFSGDFVAGEIGGKPMPQAAWLAAAALMVIPIFMVVLTMFLPDGVNRWANIIAAGFFLVFNLVGLPSYPGAYDKFLLAVSMIFNAATIYTAWQWT